MKTTLFIFLLLTGVMAAQEPVTALVMALAPLAASRW